jgi:tetratricopeptide (TPR) repeat protein
MPISRGVGSVKMPRLFKSWFTIVIGFALCGPVMAQRERDTYTATSPSAFEVTGQVRLAETGLPAAKVLVRLELFGGGTIDSSETDSRGRFRFPNLQRGYYRIIVKAPGYRTMQQDADLQVVFRSFMIFDLVPENQNALAFVDVVDARAPAGAREELSRARLALANKNNQEAIEHLRKAITLYPAFYQAHLLLGNTLMNGRQWQAAEDFFRRALEIKRDSSAATLALGEVLWRQKRYEEAERTLLEGLKLDEKSWHGHFTLSRLYWDLGQVGKAAPAIGRTLQLRPDFAEAHLLAGNVLLKVNQPQRALTEYQEYLRLEPKGEFATATRELIDKLSRTIVENKKSPN